MTRFLVKFALNPRLERHRECEYLCRMMLSVSLVFYGLIDVLEWLELKTRVFGKKSGFYPNLAELLGIRAKSKMSNFIVVRKFNVSRS